MNVLSLFDGISCGQLALERAGIRVDNYYASEIDKNAIHIANKNFPNTVHLGDIKDWKNWDIDFSKIDLITGGFPCQSFSFAGKGLNFTDERGQLFFVLFDILEEAKRKNHEIKFMFENVKMKKEIKDAISYKIGCEPVLLNSSEFSAQNRERLYWFNWGLQDNVSFKKNIKLIDIIEEGVCDRDKSYCIDANYAKGTRFEYYLRSARRQQIVSASSITELRKMHIEKCLDRKIYETLNNEVLEYKSYTDTSGDIVKHRKLLPVECERLQTLPDGYTEGISNSQRYKCVGNGWTVDVISHILSSAFSSGGRR